MNNFEVNPENNPNFASIPPEEIVIDEHVMLRTMQPSEAEEVFSVVSANREELGRWLPWVEPTQSASDSLEFIEGVRAKRENAQEAPYGIFFEGRFVGHISLMAREAQTGEIGYWLDKEAYGNGLVTKASVRLAQLGFNEMGCERIIILAEEGNEASQAVAHRLSFTEAGKLYKDDRNLIKFEKKKDEQ